MSATTNELPNELPARASWTRRDLAYAAWETSADRTTGSRGALANILFATSTKAGFDAWWETRAKVMTAAQYGCPPIVLAIAAWNGARGRDSMVAMPPEDGAAFEKWFQDGGTSVPALPVPAPDPDVERSL